MFSAPRTNITALLSQRDITHYNNSSAVSIAKIASGTRISRPGDDAASYGIAMQMRSNIAAMGQGVRNTQQSASLLQVAAGGLDQTVKALTRMKQLAVQVVNDTLGDQEIAYANEEFGHLIDHIDSAAQITRFNGRSLLTGGAGIVTTRNETKEAFGGAFDVDNNAAVGFEIENEFNAQMSSGFVYHDFSNVPSDVLLTHDDNGIYLELKGETFRGDSSLTLGSSYVLTSLSNDKNRIALNVDADNLQNATTVSGIKDALRATLVGTSLRIGSSQSSLTKADIPAAQHGNTDNIFDLDSLINWSKTSGVVQGQIGNVTGSGENGDISLQLTVGTETFRADGVGVNTGGVIEFVSTTHNGNRFAFNVQPDEATFSATDATGTGIRDILAAAFVGNADFVFDVGDPASATEFGGQGLGAFGTAADPTNVFNAELSEGFYDGTVESVDVKSNFGAYDITVVVGKQTFEAIGYKPTAADHQLTLVSKSDPGTVIALNVAQAAEANLTTDKNWQFGLETLFGLRDESLNGPVQFRSINSEMHLKNGFEMGDDASIIAMSNTASGTYAFSYQADKKMFKITDGESVWTESYDPEAQPPKSAYLEFDNGVIVSLGKDLTNPFNEDVSINQMVFHVNASNKLKFEFQVTNVSGDDLGIEMGEVTSNGLGIAELSIYGRDNARAAQKQIDNAIDKLNLNLSGIGALQTNIEGTSNTLSIQIEATQTARSTFYDVDMAEEITNFARTQTMTQAATSMLSQANQLPQTLLRLF